MVVGCTLFFLLSLPPCPASPTLLSFAHNDMENGQSCHTDHPKDVIISVVTWLRGFGFSSPSRNYPSQTYSCFSPSNSPLNAIP